MGKGSNTTTQSTTPNPAAMQAYQQILQRAQGVAQTPYQAYGGDLTAPINAQQQTGIANINQNAGFAQPYISEAAGYARQGAAPISAADIARYQDPYTQQVVDATQRQFANQNAQQQSQVMGNAAAAGALGGDRLGVAQANLAGQQSMAQSPVIAGLYSQGFGRALSAAQQQQQAQSQAGYALGNLGVAGQQAGLAGAGAQFGVGSAQQQTEQARLNALYGQYQQAQAFPYQQTQWLAGIGTGVGSQMGGTSETTGPAPNPWNQILGLGATALGAYGGSGGFKATPAAQGGRIPGFAIGGSPYEGVSGFVPAMQITPGRGAPQPSSARGQQQAQTSPPSMGSGAASGFGKLFGGAGATSLGTAGTEGFSGTAGGEAAPLGGASPAGEASSGLAGFGETLSGLGSGAWEGMAGIGAGIGEAVGGLGEGLGALFGSGAGEALAEAAPALLAFVKDGGRVSGLHARGGAVYSPGGYDDGGEVDPISGEPISGFAPITFAQRAAPVGAALHAGIFDPQAQNATTYGAPRVPATVSDAGVIPMPRPRPEALPPEIMTGQSRPQMGGFAPSSALGFADTDVDNPDSAYNRGLLPPDAAGAAPASVSSPTATPQQSGFGPGSVSPAGWHGLMTAGLGMMASRSPHLGVAIGEGGLTGMQAYATQKEREREAAEKKVTQAQQEKRIDLEAKRLAEAATRSRETLAETKRYHDILDKQRKDALSERLTRTGYVKNPDGSMSPIKGGPADPEHIAIVAKAKTTGGLLPDDTADFLAERILAGDAKALTNLGRGAQGAENVIKVQTMASRKAAERGMNPSDILAKVAEQSGLTAQQRTFGTQVARMAVNSTEAEGAIQQGLEVSQKVPRSKFVPINKLVQMAEGNISDPDLLEFRAANLAIINTYARAISPTGVPTVHDKEEAMKVVSTATSPEAYQRVMARMLKEIEIAHKAPLKAKEEMERIRKSGATPAHGTPEPAAAGSSLPKFNSPDDVTAAVKAGKLKSRDRFLDANGVERTVP